MEILASECEYPSDLMKKVESTKSKRQVNDFDVFPRIFPVSCFRRFIFFNMPLRYEINGPLLPSPRMRTANKPLTGFSSCSLYILYILSSTYYYRGVCAYLCVPYFLRFLKGFFNIAGGS